MKNGWCGREWFRKPTALIAIGLALAAQACSSPCEDYENAMYTCGQSFNRAKCDQNIGQCTSADVRTIENAAQCVENPAVCSNGQTQDLGKFVACNVPLASVSQSCQSTGL